MISVVIPVYNGEKYIERALDSILQQSFLPKEIIVVNDASTDNTYNIISNYQKKAESKLISLKIISNQINLGHTKSANIGFRFALQPYVIKLDHDDYFERHTLALLIMNIKHYNFAYGDYYEIENSQLKYNKVDHPFETTACAILFKKSALEKVNYYSEDIMFTEYDLLLKLGFNTGIYIDKPLYTYMRRVGSMTKSNWYQNALNQFELIHGKDLTSKIRLY